MSETPMPIKSGDVFQFRYNPKEEFFMSDHCFDGQLVATETNRGLVLVDTYWHGSNNRTFTPAEAEEKGVLRFVCNMADVVDIQEYETRLYDAKDIFNLSRQHGCYKHYVRRKDSARSKEAMLTVAYKSLNEYREAIKRKTHEIERMARKIQEIEGGKDLNEVHL